MAKHRCGHDESYGHCCVCEGIMHNPLCTAKLKASEDCCPKRHKMLFEQGQMVGIGDSSLPMWLPEDEWKLKKNSWYAEREIK